MSAEKRGLREFGDKCLALLAMDMDDIDATVGTRSFKTEENSRKR